MKPLVLLAVASATFFSSPASAEQTPYKQTDDGWYVYVEDRSCVAYVDYEGDEGSMMLRFSARADEGRTYFAIVSTGWNDLESRIGEAVTLNIEFPERKIAYGSAGMVMRNTDGRMGYAGADYDIAQLQKELSTNSAMDVTVTTGSAVAVKTKTVAEISLDGAPVAMMHLAKCTAEKFPKPA